MLFIIRVKKNPPPFPVQQDPCCMLHSQHAQCNKITCCTLLHKAYYWWPFSKVDLYIQFYIQQDPYVDLVASGKCCILLHSAWYPLIDKERLGLNQIMAVSVEYPGTRVPGTALDSWHSFFWYYQCGHTLQVNFSLELLTFQRLLSSLYPVEYSCLDAGVCCD